MFRATGGLVDQEMSALAVLMDNREEDFKKSEHFVLGDVINRGRGMVDYVELVFRNKSNTDTILQSSNNTENDVLIEDFLGHQTGGNPFEYKV